MIADPIVEDVRASRRKILNLYDSLESYNLDIIKRQIQYGTRLISREPNKIKISLISTDENTTDTPINSNILI